MPYGILKYECGVASSFCADQAMQPCVVVAVYSHLLCAHSFSVYTVVGALPSSLSLSLSPFLLLCVSLCVSVRRAL